MCWAVAFQAMVTILSMLKFPTILIYSLTRIPLSGGFTSSVYMDKRLR